MKTGSYSSDGHLAPLGEGTAQPEALSGTRAAEFCDSSRVSPRQKLSQRRTRFGRADGVASSSRTTAFAGALVVRLPFFASATLASVSAGARSPCCCAAQTCSACGSTTAPHCILPCCILYPAVRCVFCTSGVNLYVVYTCAHVYTRYTQHVAIVACCPAEKHTPMGGRQQCGEDGA